jgi:hypothetical protein
VYNLSNENKLHVFAFWFELDFLGYFPLRNLFFGIISIHCRIENALCWTKLHFD